MRGRYKRRGRLSKLLSVLSLLFLFSLWRYYRDHTGIFYTHIGILATAGFGCGLTVQRVRRKKKKRAPGLVRSAHYTKSRIGYHETIRRFRAALLARGIIRRADYRIDTLVPKKRGK